MHFYQPNTNVTTLATNSFFFFLFFFFFSSCCIGWCSSGPGGSVKQRWFCLGLILGFVIFGGGMQLWLYIMRGEKAERKEKK